MRMIPQEDIIHLENMIYLPMVLKVLDLDRQAIEKGPFKMKGPYLELIDKAEKLIRTDLQKTKIHMTKNYLRVILGKRDKEFTEYIFYHEGFEDHRNYSNIRLRNRTEELLAGYLKEVSKVKTEYPLQVKEEG